MRQKTTYYANVFGLKEAKITKGYNLPAKRNEIMFIQRKKTGNGQKLIRNLIDVIHTVGPQSEKPAILANCYRNSLQTLADNQLRSIAFPCIATGVYGYDNERAADVALTTVRGFLQDQLAKGQDKV